MLNQIVIMGRLTRNPEVRTVGAEAKSIKLATFTLACDRDFTPNAKKKETDFIECAAWRNNADYVEKYFQQGRMAVVRGRLEIHTYKDKNGNTRQKAQVAVESIYPCNAPTARNEATATEHQPAPTPNTPGDFAVLDDDDAQLPF